MQGSRHLLKKLAASKNRHHKLENTVDVVGSGVGAGVAKHMYSHGHLTGRETLYHGSDPQYKDSILENGIVPNKSPGTIDNIEARSGKDYRSKGLSFAHKNPREALKYGRQSADLGGKTELGREVDKHGLLGAYRRHVTKINAPTWKENEFKRVKNPETAIKTEGLSSKFLKRQTAKDLDENTFVNQGKFHPKYFTDSSHYQPNSIGEIADFAKHHTGRFSKGLAGAAAGAGLAAGGLYDLLRKHKKSR